MNRADECKYNVIQFLEAPYKDIADFVCVPRFWVQSRAPDDRKVRVSYPDEKSSDTEKSVKKRKKKLDQWKSYLCVVKHRTDSYDEAKLYIQGMIPEMRNADNPQSSAMVEETPRRCARFTTRSANMNIMDDVDLNPTNNLKSTKETTLKRKALPGPDKKSHNKRLRVTEPHQSDYETAEPSSQAFELTSENQSLNPEISDEDLCIQELRFKNSNDINNAENRPPVNPNPSEANHSLDPEIIAKQEFIGELFTICVRELQTNLQIYTSSLFTETVNKFMSNVNMCFAWRYNCPITTPSKNTTQKAPKLNEKKINEGKDDDDEDIQPLKKESCTKRIKKVVLPPEYDENDSRWTLKYRKPAPGLVELMPHTGVYVKALSLTNCKRLSKDCKTLARMLLTAIFTKIALSTCSWTGTRAKAFDRDGTNVRPGLNEHARTVLLNYVADRAENEGWNNCENQIILNSIRNKMQEMRCKYEF